MSLLSSAASDPFPAIHQTTEETRRESDAGKRKRENGENGKTKGVLGESFSIRPDSSDPFALTRTFTPLHLLARSQLSLAFLDTQAAGSNRLFSARIPALDVLDEGDDEGCVLIVEEAREGRLYAVERASGSTYALCRLGAWVKKEVLIRAKSNVRDHERSDKRRKILVDVEAKDKWWSRAAVSLPEDDAVQVTSALRVSMKVAAPKDTAVTSKQTMFVLDTVDIAGQDAPEVAIQPSAIDVLQELAKQYQETLYLSRTSLAYFTKGPLSRARAAFTTSHGSDLQITELIEFLRETILTASMIDKKYKDGLQNIVTDLPPAGLETPEQATKPKKKRRWKSKRDKYGFWSEEKEFVEKWWQLQDDRATPPHTVDNVEVALKRRLPTLRSRETYLQVMVALEVLALEAAFPQTDVEPAVTGFEIQGAERQDAESQPAAKNGKKPKAKKKQDLPALLEVLLDRLCIWHSLESHSPTKPRTEGDRDDEDNADELRSFCIEVVLPFYVSRIPQHATTVNRKLGGPSAPAPVAKRKTTSTRKPGEPAVRPAPERSRERKPLSRVASETTYRGLPRAGLHRSATDTDVLQQHLKRESSESPSLDSIKPAPAPQSRKRTSLIHSLPSFSRREVDLSAISKANEKKMLKKAEVEEKLREAIKGVRKPDRTEAVKEVAERVDGKVAESRRRMGAAARSKSSAGMSADVAVAATPMKGARVKGTPWKASAGIAGSSSAGLASTTSKTTSGAPSPSVRFRAAPRTLDDLHEGEAPTSSFAIPQTRHRQRHRADSFRSMPKATATMGVMETPSRGFAKCMPEGLSRQPGTLDSPTASRSLRVAGVQVGETPVKPVRPLELGRPNEASTMGKALVEASPNAVRIGSPPRTGFRHEAEIDDPSSRAVGLAAGGNIYAALGWEEEYEPLE